MYKFGILGVGKMGGSILKGILSSGVYKKDEILLNLHSDRDVEMYRQEGYHIVVNHPDELLKNSEMILLAVKPQIYPEIAEIADKMDFTGKGVMSIMAGITIGSIESHFKGASVIRVMPNTPALIKKCVATVCASDTDSEYYKKAFEVLSSIGVAYAVPESQMDTSLALNGSMPAYLELFAKAFIDKAVEDGIDYETAKQLTCQSIISTANLILNSGDSLEQLIKNVCSKGGTTLAGLDRLYANNFEKAIKECSEACAKRSKELAK